MRRSSSASQCAQPSMSVTNDARSLAQLGKKLRVVQAFASSLSMLQLSLPPCHSRALAVQITSSYSRQFNTQVSLPNVITRSVLLWIPHNKYKVLSGIFQAQHFHILLESSSPANRTRLLSVASPHASSWLY